MAKTSGKRTLKYAILGLLSQKESTGYDIRTSFTEALGQFWSAKHSQIYVELKKLLAEELITQKIGYSGKLEKKWYSLTPKGKQELNEWLLDDDAEIETAKDVFALRLFFLKDIPTPEAHKLFEKQKAEREQRLSFLKGQLKEIFNDTSKPEDLTTEDLGHYFVLTKAINREDAYLVWLKNCMRILALR